MGRSKDLGGGTGDDEAPVARVDVRTLAGLLVSGGAQRAEAEADMKAASSAKAPPPRPPRTVSSHWIEDAESENVREVSTTLETASPKCVTGGPGHAKEYEYAKLFVRADAWDTAGRPQRMLLKDPASRFWADSLALPGETGAPPEPVRAYVAASIVRGRSRRWRRRAGVALILAALLGVAIAAGVLYFRADAEAKLAADGEREAQAQASSARASERGAVSQQAVAAALLLAGKGGVPRDGAEMHALLRAAEIARCIGQPTLVMGELAAAVNGLAAAPWFFDLKGHTDRVSHVAFDHTGAFLASGSDDGTVRIRRMEQPDGAPSELPMPSTADAAVLSCDDEQVRSLAWSVNGLLAAGCSTPGTRSDRSTASLLIWARQPGDRGCWSVRHRLRSHAAAVEALAWSHDGTLLASADVTGVVRVWRVDAASAAGSAEVAYQEFVDREERAVFAMSFAPDKPLLAFGGAGGRIDFWTLQETDDQPRNVLGVDAPKGPGIDAEIAALAWSPDGEVLAGSGIGGWVSLWGKPLDRENSSSPELSLLATELFAHDGAGVYGLAWSGDGARLATVGSNAARVYRLSPLVGPVNRLELEDEFVQTPAAANLLSVDFHAANSSTLVAAGGASDHTVRGWRAHDNLNVRGPEAFLMNCTETFSVFEVRGSDWSEDGHTYAASSSQGDICVWQRPLSTGADGSARAGPWELTGALSIPRAESRPIPSHVVALGRDAAMLAAGDDLSGVTVWSWSNGSADLGSWVLSHQWRSVDRLRGGALDREIAMLRSLAWSIDSRFLAAGSSNNTVCVLPVGSGGGEALHLQGHASPVLAVAWTARSAEVLLLASGSADRTVRVWTLQPSGGTRTAPPSLVGVRAVAEHTSDVVSLAWSPTRLLASGSADARVIVHRVPERGGARPLARRVTLTGHTGAVTGLSWSADGGQLASSSLDGMVRVWGLPEGDGDHVTVWMLAERCTWSRWIALPTPRLACARRSPTGRPDPPAGEAPYTQYVSYTLVDPEQQLALLRRMTYGDLDEDDLSRLGLLAVRDFALSPVIADQVCLAGNSSTPPSTECTVPS